MANRAARGAGLGLGAGAFAVVFVLLTRGATLAQNKPLFAELAIGFIVAALTAVRDELMLRGFVLRALAGWPLWWALLIACGLAGASAQLGAQGTTAIEVAAAGISGVASGAIWQKDRGAWMAVGARTAWLFASGAIIRGGLLDLRFANTAWGNASMIVASTIIALAAITWSRASSP
jgi:hypothetical protein